MQSHLATVDLTLPGPLLDYVRLVLPLLLQLVPPPRSPAPGVERELGFSNINDDNGLEMDKQDLT